MPLAEVVPLLKQKIANAKDNNETIIFTITGVKKTGFQVKTKGIYAFVPFKLMPFTFTLDIWDFIKYELINASFFAQVSDLDLENNRIILDATITKFDEFTLLNVYFPNGKRDKGRLQYKMDFYEYFLKYINKYVE